MKFSISKNKLVQATALVKQAVAGKTTRPILKTVYMDARDDGWLTLRATDAILDITVQIKADIEQPGTVCVDSLVLDLLPTFEDSKYDQVGLLTNPIKFNLSNPVVTDVGMEGKQVSRKLTISQGKRKHSPVYMDPAEFPQKPVIEDYTKVGWEDKVKMIGAFQRLQVSVSDLIDRRVLQAFHINPHSNFIISGDGNRISLFDGIEVPGNITNPPARIIMSVLSHVTSLSANDNFEVKFGGWSGFKSEQVLDGQVTGKWEIIFNSLSGEFPEQARATILDARQATPKLKIITEKKTLENILGVCRIYSTRATDEGKDNFVRLSKNGNGVVFSMKVPELVDMEEPLDAEVEGDEFEICFHPDTLLEAMATIKSSKAEFRFFDERLPFIMLDNETPEYTYLQVAMGMK